MTVKPPAPLAFAHGYTRGRGSRFGAGSATVMLLLDRREIQAGIHYDHDSPEIFRFHSGLPSEYIEYILWDDRIEFLGEQKAKRPKPWGDCPVQAEGWTMGASLPTAGAV